jgi:hypothetical protein
MYYYLVKSLKRRLVLELQNSFGKHPVYEKISPYIQNKHAFEERPQYGIVVKGASGNKIQLSSQNHLGNIVSHVMLAYLDNPVHLLEWVKEDYSLVKSLGDRMPTAPGVYYIECLTAPTNAGEFGTFMIDPLLTETGEPLLLVTATAVGRVIETRLQNLPVPGMLRVWENRRYLLQEGTDYSVDYETGVITLLYDLAEGTILTADYRHIAPSIGPVEWSWNKSDFNTLPGVILAFGKRGRAGDKMAVVIYSDRVDAAEAEGGRFEFSFDLDVISRDPEQSEEIADLAVMYLWAEKRKTLSSEGLEITDVSMGGESEDVYDEAADLYYYNTSLSVTIQGDWEIHIPRALTTSRLNTGPAGTKKGLVASTQGLLFATTPIIVGRNNSYERIG